jgi:hypothetical protein
MKPIYSGQDLLRMGHLKGVLETYGIECVVRNLHLTAGIGELPPIECWPEIWVMDDADYERALAVLERALAPLRSVKLPWQCGRCGERIEGHFLECWNCGSDRRRSTQVNRG